MLSNAGSEMIANGCYWTEDRQRDRPIDHQTRNNKLFWILLPAGIIQDPNQRIDDEAFDVRRRKARLAASVKERHLFFNDFYKAYSSPYVVGT